MDLNKSFTDKSPLATWPEGFENVTCPKALILVGATVLNDGISLPARVKETLRAISGETYKNHISVNQACLLMHYVEISIERYKRLCDLAAIQGGGREILEHKYLSDNYFKKELDALIDALEWNRSFDSDIDERIISCNLSDLFNNKCETHS